MRSRVRPDGCAHPARTVVPAWEVWFSPDVPPIYFLNCRSRGEGTKNSGRKRTTDGVELPAGRLSWSAICSLLLLRKGTELSEANPDYSAKEMPMPDENSFSDRKSVV